MKAKIKVISELQRQHAIKVLEQLPLDVVHVLDIRPFVKNRSTAQKGLYFIWVGQIANHFGEEKNTVHIRLKKTHLIPIYMAREDGEWARTVETIRDVYRLGMKDKAKQMEAHIVSLASTNDATVPEFTEYLNQIEIEYAGMGLVLVHPDDLWMEAMGKDR